MSELVRAFVAVRVPGYIADTLDNFLAELRPLAPIRWVRREQFHITLKFLGELRQDVIAQVMDALEPLKLFDTFSIELDHIGAFPNLAAPRVLWLSGKKGGSELGRVARLVDDVLADDVGLERDSRKFRPHLTLARLKDTRLPEDLVRKLGEVPVMAWECSELVLMRSQLTPKGPIYSQLL